MTLKYQKKQNMVLLHFKSTVQLVLGGNLMNIAQTIGSEINQPTSFSLCCWVGGENQDMTMDTIHPETNEVETKIQIHEKDTDTLKFAATIHMANPYGNRPYILASSFIPIEQLCDLLEEKQKAYFTMTSNFDRNAVIIQFKNQTTKVNHVRALALQPSVLRKAPLLGSIIDKISSNLQETVSKLQITPDMGAPQFIPMNTRTFLPMQNISACYALIPTLFDNIIHNPVSLSWLMYDMYQTIHHTRLHPETLQKMTDKELIVHFGCPMIQNRCNCALTSPYSEDLTSDKAGRVTQGTEEINLTFSQMALRAQISGPYQVSKKPSANKSIDEIIDSLVEARNTISQALTQPGASLPPRITAAVILDDCENGAQGFIMQHKALKSIYEQAGGNLANLANMMKNTAKKYPNLFDNISDKLHTIMAPVLFRLGKLAFDKKWNTSMTVVTARNRAMDIANTPAGMGLAGHGVCLSQIIQPDGNICYEPMEATCSMKVQPSKKTLGRKHDIEVRMADGSYKSMPLADVMNIYNQNIHMALSISPFHVIQANIAESDEYEADWKRGAFYVGAFYTGFAFQPNALGCMPCTNQEFGAPVHSLGANHTTALPIESITPLLPSLFKQLTTEAWPPPATEADMNNVMSAWPKIQRISSSSGLLTYDNYKKYCTSLISCAFDCPEKKQDAFQLYQLIASTFNQFQESDKFNDDGHRLYASVDYHSAFLNIMLKIPPDGEKMPCGTMNNIAKTVEKLNLHRLVQCPYKQAKMQKRMDLPTPQTFYKCSEGDGIVHSFQHMLA